MHRNRCTETTEQHAADSSRKKLVFRRTGRDTTYTRGKFISFSYHLLLQRCIFQVKGSQLCVSVSCLSIVADNVADTLTARVCMSRVNVDGQHVMRDMWLEVLCQYTA